MSSPISFVPPFTTGEVAENLLKAAQESQTVPLPPTTSISEETNPTAQAEEANIAVQEKKEEEKKGLLDTLYDYTIGPIVNFFSPDSKKEQTATTQTQTSENIDTQTTPQTAATQNKNNILNDIGVHVTDNKTSKLAQSLRGGLLGILCIAFPPLALIGLLFKPLREKATNWVKTGNYNLNEEQQKALLAQQEQTQPQEQPQHETPAAQQQVQQRELEIKNFINKYGLGSISDIPTLKAQLSANGLSITTLGDKEVVIDKNNNYYELNEIIEENKKLQQAQQTQQVEPKTAQTAQLRETPTQTQGCGPVSSVLGFCPNLSESQDPKTRDPKSSGSLGMFK